jgi:chondroitin 4-sulfotransferase 11
MTIKEEMSARVSVLKNACKLYGLDQKSNESLHQPNPWEYLINEEHGLVWCNVFKSGSTRSAVMEFCFIVLKNYC